MNENDTISFFEKVRYNTKININNLCYGCMEPFDNNYKVCPHCGYVVGSKPEEPVYITSGTVLKNRYIMGKALGHGSFGVTYIAWDNVLMQKVAIKEFLPSDFSTRMPGKTMITILGGDKSCQFHDGMKKFVDEARRLAKFKNEPGIVKVFDSFEENNSAYIVMELLEGETVAEYIKQNGPIQEDKVVEMLSPVLASLENVHKEGIIHRDIAPDNIFITKNGEVKLIDFGAARYATTSYTRTITTLIKTGYSPEEQYRSSGDQGPHTDVYALGATLYKMMTGKTPPDGLERRTQYESKGKDILIPPSKLKKGISRVREVAILNALNIKIEDRTPDITTFAEELNANKPARRINGKIKKLTTYRWPLWAKISIPTVLIALVTFIIMLLTGVISFNAHSNEEIYLPEGYVISPNIEGCMNTTAQSLVENSGLQYNVMGQIYSEYCDANVVIYQNPIAGAYVLEQDIVEVKICSGTKEIIHDGDKVVVPFLTAMNIEEAKELLTNAKLKYEIIEKNDDNMQKNLVISSVPEAGMSIEENSTVTIYVSIGSKFFDMINIVGLDYKEATTQLNKLGLKVIYEYEFDNSVPENQVIKQSVEDGGQVVKGDEIVLTVALSKADEMVEIPNVIGKSETEAREILEKLEFKVTISTEYSSETELGKVIRTSPYSGTNQKKGSDIIIYVSKGAEVFTITLNSNGGELNTNIINIKKGDLLAGLPIPVRNNYQFTGWYTQPSGGIQVSNGISVPSNMILYAQWKSNKQNESVPVETTKGNDETTKGNDETTKNNDETTVAVTAISISASVKQDTRFIGDTINKSDINVKVKMSDGTTIEPTDFTTTSLKLTSKSNEIVVTYKDLSAKVTVNAENKSYILTFNANGGTTDVASISVEYKAPYGNLPNATREGYIFEGWFSEPGGGEQITSSTQMLNGNVTIYAHWKKIEAISMSIVSNPNAVYYWIGDTFSAAGFSAVVAYNNGVSKNVYDNECSFSTPNMGESGIKTVYASYSGQSCAFNIEVKLPTISITGGNVGNTNTQLSTNCNPGGSVRWESSNLNVAYVSNGTITATGVGSATIYAILTYNGREYYAQKNVDVQLKYSDWGSEQSTTTRPIESDVLSIIGQSTKYNYYHWCNQYSDGSWGVDSCKVGGGYTNPCRISIDYQLATVGINGDYGGKAGQACGYLDCSCRFKVWWLESTVTTYFYKTRNASNIIHSIS